MFIVYDCKPTVYVIHCKPENIWNQKGTCTNKILKKKHLCTQKKTERKYVERNSKLLFLYYGNNL